MMINNHKSQFSAIILMFEPSMITGVALTLYLNKRESSPCRGSTCRIDTAQAHKSKKLVARHWQRTAIYAAKINAATCAHTYIYIVILIEN